jgi:hypothetical protein
MIAIGLLFVRMLCDCFKSRRRLEAEIVVLRHELNILQQCMPRRVYLRWAHRALFIWLYRRCPRILDAITVVRPETVVRWHRMGFAAYWGWKSRPLGGRPQIGKEVRDLIRRMSFENPLWGAPKIHGELLKLGIEVAQSTVSIYMVPRQDRPLQTWKTFLCNHVEGIASIDFIVVPTIAFQQLFAFLVLGHGQRRLLWNALSLVEDEIFRCPVPRKPPNRQRVQSSRASDGDPGPAHFVPFALAEWVYRAGWT